MFYELLIGAPPFHGDDLAEILASVVKDSPDLSKAPPQVRCLLASCLEKDPRKRLRDIGDVWRLMDAAPAASVPDKKSGRWAWAVAALLGLMALSGWLRSGKPVSEQQAMTLSIVPRTRFGRESGVPWVAKAPCPNSHPMDRRDCSPQTDESMCAGWIRSSRSRCRARKQAATCLSGRRIQPP